MAVSLHFVTIHSAGPLAVLESHCGAGPTVGLQTYQHDSYITIHFNAVLVKAL